MLVMEHIGTNKVKLKYWFVNTWRFLYSFVFLMMGGGTA